LNHDTNNRSIVSNDIEPVGKKPKKLPTMESTEADRFTAAFYQTFEE
jgi:hypothetical protein